MLDDPSSFFGLIKSLWFAAIDGLRRNKLPACLSLVALIVCTALAATSEFDERPRYRAWTLPKIVKAEAEFFATMGAAQQATDEELRHYYFLAGHLKAKAALRIARTNYPATSAGHKAQDELVRYYELVDEQFAIIRTEMSLHESFDYMGEWNRVNAELRPIRDRWANWVQGN